MLVIVDCLHDCVFSSIWKLGCSVFTWTVAIIHVWKLDDDDDDGDDDDLETDELSIWLKNKFIWNCVEAIATWETNEAR